MIKIKGSRSILIDKREEYSVEFVDGGRGGWLGRGYELVEKV